MVIRVTAQGTTRVHRITAPGTTVVKTITVGTPSITGTAALGTLSGLDDVSTANRSDGRLISWDSSASTHVYTPLNTSVRQLISVQDLGGDGSLSYAEETGVIVYIGPSDLEARAHFSATNSISYDSTLGIFDFNFDSAINNVKTHIVPISNENIDLGDSNYKFRDLWLKGTTIHLGSITVNDISGTFTVKDSTGAIAPLNLAGNTTTDLTEGTNLYYTDTRARTSITVNTDNTGQITYDSSNGTFTFADSNFARTDIQDVFHEGLTIPDTKKIVFCDNVADIFENGGNFFIRRTNNDLPGESGGNIYLMTKDDGFFYIKSFDGNRDLAHFHDNGPVQLYYANSLKLATRDSGVNITGNTRISGNLTVDGTTTSINSSELVVGDKNIILADSAPDAAAANGGGITLNGANATILYANATDTWDFNKAFGTGINVLSNYTTNELTEGNNLYYSRSRWDSALSSVSTNELTEGTNLYYTRSRWDSALSSVSTTQLAEGNNLYYTTVRADSAFDVRLATKSTTDLSEGTNLYYTRNRFDSALGDDFSSSVIYEKFSVSGDLAYDNGTGLFSFSLSNFTTDSVSEGPTNLYYTTVRFDSDFGDNTTSDLIEGTNLYYTQVRVDSAFDARLATKTTNNLTEGTNLYYTSARADSDAKNAISVSGDLTYDPNTGIMSIDVEQIYTFNNFDSDFRQRLTTTTTDSIGEGSNLYYTSARADSDARHSLALNDLGGDGSLTYNSSTGVIAYTGPSAAEVRAHFSATGDLSYDSATGIFTVDVSDIYSKAEFDSDLGDANTDQLPEGNTNLYYTASRADSDAKHALTGGTSIVYSSDTGTMSTVQAIDSTDNVSFNTITNKDGTTTNTPAAVVVTDTSPNVLDNFAHNNQPVSFEYLVHLFDSTNSATQITKMIGTYDGTNIASNEFGTVFTGADYMGELDFDINGNNIRLLYTKEATLGTVRTKAIKTIIS